MNSPVLNPVSFCVSSRVSVSVCVASYTYSLPSSPLPSRNMSAPKLYSMSFQRSAIEALTPARSGLAVLYSA